jgi:E3 ubiquitin-protein ligase HERC4
VYAFGLGGAGQLGTKAVRSAATPQVVLGPWVSPGGVSVVEAGVQSEHASDCMVKRIYSGGDHCFATVTHKEVNLKHKTPHEFRRPTCMVENLDSVFVSSSIK